MLRKEKLQWVHLEVVSPAGLHLNGSWAAAWGLSSGRHTWWSWWYQNAPAGFASAPPRSAPTNSFRWSLVRLAIITLPHDRTRKQLEWQRLKGQQCHLHPAFLTSAVISPTLLMRSVSLPSLWVYQSFIFSWEVRVTRVERSRGSMEWPCPLLASGTQASRSTAAIGFTNWC